MSDPARRRARRCVHMLVRRRALFATVVALAAATALPASAGASIAFRGASHASVQGAWGVWVMRPAGLKAGDVMVATVAVGGSHLAIAGSGRKPLRTTTPSTSLQQLSFYRVAASSEFFAYYFGAASGRSDVSAAVAAYSGVDPSDPIDAVADAAGVDAGAIPS